MTPSEPPGGRRRNELRDPLGLRLRSRAANGRAPQSWVHIHDWSLCVDRLPAMSAGPAARRFVELATLLTTGHIAHGRRAIAVCGAVTGAGVSFVASNLAIALANSGLRIRLVDTNMRSPSLHEAIRGPERMPGLSEYLLDGDLLRLEDVSGEILPGLVFTPVGDRADDAADLLASRRFSDFAQACLRDAECTIFDTSPANRSVDPCVVASEAGYALIVARRTQSYFEDVSTLCAQLARQGVQVVGSILNAQR